MSTKPEVSAVNRPVTGPGLGAAPEPGAADSRPVLLMADADVLTVWALRLYVSGSYRVVSVGKTDQALEYLRQGRVDAVVVSDNLPGGEWDGLVELALRRVGSGKVVKLQSLVEQPADEAREPTIVLEKPFDLGMLKDLLEKMLPTEPLGPAGPSTSHAGS